MDFELEQNTILCYEPVGQAVVTREETQEAIVPDACPDMLRIADVCAQILTERRETGDGQARVSGCVRATVLYVPEEGNTVRRLELKLPFDFSCEIEGVTADCVLMTRARLKGADARILNPRKLLLRADVGVECTALRRREHIVSSGVMGDGDGHICQKLEKIEHERLSACVQRSFPLSEEIRLTGTQPPELLWSRVTAVCTESRMIGSKLIFKGRADAQLLLQSGDNIFERRVESFPFSQIMEAKGVGEGGNALVQLEMSSVSCIQLPDDPFRVMVEGEIMAFGQVFDHEETTVLTDLYSTADEMVLEDEELTLYGPGEVSVIPQTLRDLLESQEAVRVVCDSRFEPGPLRRVWENGVLTLTAPGRIVVLCLDEGRQLKRLEKQVEVSVRHSCPADARVICRCGVSEDVFAAPCAGGIEVRLNLEFHIFSASPVSCRVVRRVQSGEPRGGETARPSVILRRPEPGEELWDVAKVCGSTVERIAQANELNPGDMPPQRMLLIPSAR